MSLFRFVVRNLTLWIIALVFCCVFASAAMAQPCGCQSQGQERHPGPLRSFFQSIRPGILIPKSQPRFRAPAPLATATAPAEIAPEAPLFTPVNSLYPGCQGGSCSTAVRPRIIRR